MSTQRSLRVHRLVLKEPWEGSKCPNVSSVSFLAEWTTPMAPDVKIIDLCCSVSVSSVEGWGLGPCHAHGLRYFLFGFLPLIFLFLWINFFLTLLLQTMLKADLYLRGRCCRFSTKTKYWGETVSRRLFNVKMFTGKVYTSEMKTQTRKNG